MTREEAGYMDSGQVTGDFEDMLRMRLCPIDQPSSDTVHKQCSQTLKSFITIAKQTTIDNEASFTHSGTLL